MGGHVRGGLEDNLYHEHETHEPATNAALVSRLVMLATAVGRRVATPREARKIIGLATRPVAPALIRK